MASSYRFVVSGQVQGVGFRYTALAMAQRLKLSGWIGNRADGAVEGVAAGAPEQLDAFRAWLTRGPPAARVASVEWTGSDEPTGVGFTIQGR